MRIAFFGGTFDPIHRGHLAIASAAADAFALDRVLFAPVGLQPLKAAPPVASFADRLAMVTLACAAAGRDQSSGTLFVPSGIDAPSGGFPNYTAAALDALALEYPNATLYALAGADSFLTLPNWHEPNRLLSLAEWIVVSRPESPVTESQLASLALIAPQRARIHLLNTVHEEVSGTELRRLLHEGDPASSLLPPSVAAYIQAHRLYR
jgi:nicotinate-nucleotide adenylyltransferase